MWFAVTCILVQGGFWWFAVIRRTPKWLYVLPRKVKVMTMAIADSSTFVFQTFDWREYLKSLAFVTCVILFSLFFLRPRKSTKYPPVCKGWIPWLGCAVEFGKRPLNFIEQKRKEVKAHDQMIDIGSCMTVYISSITS